MISRFLQNIGRQRTLERLLGPPLESLDIVSFTKRRASFKPMTDAAPTVPEEAAFGAGELTRLDEAVFLLQTAAEIEHALMVQYLYSALSVELDASKLTGTSIPPSAGDLTLRWFREIFQIAKEEMDEHPQPSPTQEMKNKQ